MAAVAKMVIFHEPARGGCGLWIYQNSLRMIGNVVAKKVTAHKKSHTKAKEKGRGKKRGEKNTQPFEFDVLVLFDMEMYSREWAIVFTQEVPLWAL